MTTEQEMPPTTPEQGETAGQVIGSIIPHGVFVLIQMGVYAVAILPCVPLVRWTVEELGPLWGWAVGLALSLHVATLGVLALAALLRGLLGGRVEPGDYAMNSPQAYRWLRNFAFCEIARRSPFFGYVHHYSPVAVIFYRLMGCRMAWTAQLGSDTRLTDPWLIEIGPGATIGDGAIVAGHYIQGRTLVLRRVVIERGATVGGKAAVMPGCRIGEGATVVGCSLVAKDRVVPAGEVWLGVPARKIGVNTK